MGASYAAREKGAKRGSKRDKRDAVTPAAGKGSKHCFTQTLARDVGP